LNNPFLRPLLTALEVPYTAAAFLRNVLYDCGIKKTHHAALPIVSVGNLTLGGTGKTPMTAYLAEFFLKQGLRPAIISRGYRKTANNVNDEFLELSLRLPNVPHLQNPNRVAAAAELAERQGDEAVDVLILDDAFQHRRIARNTDIVLLDATQPFGFDRIFPRGTLRETLNGLKRADVVLLSRADLIDQAQRQRIKERVLSITPNVLWGEVIHEPKCLISQTAQVPFTPPFPDLGSVLAFCGLGNPAAFEHTLKSCGTNVQEFIAFPDHYHYQESDLDDLERLVAEKNIDTVLCTMKDFVKIKRPALRNIPIQAVAVGIRFLDGEEEFKKLNFTSTSSTPFAKSRR
jgi:tetraacyldisaccharide 4'-kinase